MAIRKIDPTYTLIKLFHKITEDDKLVAKKLSKSHENENS